MKRGRTRHGDWGGREREGWGGKETKRREREGGGESNKHGIIG